MIPFVVQVDYNILDSKAYLKDLKPAARALADHPAIIFHYNSTKLEKPRKTFLLNFFYRQVPWLSSGDWRHTVDGCDLG